MTETEILDRLEGVRPKVGYHIAKCPSHDDKHQSLSVATGNDGRVLMKCHAGCEAEAITGALGLSLADLFPPKDSVPIAATYDYRDEARTLLYQVVRKPPKQFRQRRPNPLGGWTWNLEGVRRVLYRLPQLLSDTKPTVYIVEGEKDADKLKGLGLMATTNAGGATKWRDEYSASLKERDVVILPDNDDPGRAHAAQVASSLKGVAARVRVIDLPGLEPKGDVSDWLKTHTKAELEALEPGSVEDDGFESSAVRIVGEEEERKALGAAVVPFGISYLDDACRGILPRDVIVLGAYTGVGKTQLAATIAMEAARARRRVYFFALEAEPDEIERRAKYREIVSLLYASGQGIGHMTYLDWYLHRCHDIAGPVEVEAEALFRERYATLHTYYRLAGEFTVKTLAKRLDQIRDKADLIILDHLHYVDSDETENKAIKSIISAIRSSALDTGKPVIVIAHLRKKERSKPRLVPELDDFHGASDLTKICTRAIVIARASDQRTTQNSVAATYMSVGKDRPAGAHEGNVALCYFDLATGTYRDAYRLGRLSFMGDEWAAIEKIPHWAKHATRYDSEGML